MVDVTSLQNSTIWAINNLGTTPFQVCPLGPSRKKLVFYNPGTIDAVVFPLTAFPLTVGSQFNPPTGSAVLTPSTSALGGGIRVFANGGTVSFDGQSCKQAWQALSVSGSGNPLTIEEQT